ncbi:MAG: TrmH family RNA methyltransferase [Treponema sp.]|jgi:TrmH family RNA methyltransferase|nr:TrmH family RNA methyltransferase [Treponema sp.]
MIPVHKLEKLPRSQRLRKIAKIFGEAEYRLSRDEPLPSQTGACFREILDLLLRDEAFSPEAAEALRRARFSPEAPGTGVSLRDLNTVRHILHAETGRQVADWDFIDHHGRLDPRNRRCFAGMSIYLEDIRSPYNVGAMFRAAESFGAERLYLSPLCADPRHPRAERSAMGCVSVLPWERRALSALEGLFFALETGGIPLQEYRFPQKAVLIAGSEELGVSPEALALADRSLGRISVQTYGAKGSLNVAVAFGIVMQAWALSLSGAGEKVRHN